MSQGNSQTEQIVNNASGGAVESDDSDHRARVRVLNDRLRQAGQGGRMVMTAGVAALPLDEQLGIVAAVMAFEAFDPGDDLYGEHDFGALRIGAHQVMFKIDYYDKSLRLHSPDPSDPAVTRRVLTVMLAEDY